MTVGFDLDGTLDCPKLAALAVQLAKSGAAVHVITGIFEGKNGAWQNEREKIDKLERLGLIDQYRAPKHGLRIHFVRSPSVDEDVAFRLREIGLKKGALCEELGIDIMIEDSPEYCELIPMFSRGTRVLQVR